VFYGNRYEQLCLLNSDAIYQNIREFACPGAWYKCRRNKGRVKTYRLRKANATVT
jgi:hypothetical protein